MVPKCFGLSPRKIKVADNYCHLKYTNIVNKPFNKKPCQLIFFSFMTDIIIFVIVKAKCVIGNHLV